MAVDTPATIAVIGAGPIGLEAALYARFLGYDVRVYERARVVERLRAAAAGEPALSWHSYTSPLGVAALAAQNPAWAPPTADAMLSPAELTEAYFLPLAASDLLVDHLLLGLEVLSLERDATGDSEPLAEDEILGFRLRVRVSDAERVDTADVVIDASGAAARSFGLAPAEPDFYVLGAKCAAEPNAFRYVDGLVQIRDLFKIVADRTALDLYASMRGNV